MTCNAADKLFLFLFFCLVRKGFARMQMITKNMRRVGLSRYANVEVLIWDRREGPLYRRGAFCIQVFLMNDVALSKSSKETTTCGEIVAGNPHETKSGVSDM